MATFLVKKLAIMSTGAAFAPPQNEECVSNFVFYKIGRYLMYFSEETKNSYKQTAQQNKNSFTNRDKGENFNGRANTPTPTNSFSSDENKAANPNFI